MNEGKHLMGRSTIQSIREVKHPFTGGSRLKGPTETLYYPIDIQSEGGGSGFLRETN